MVIINPQVAFTLNVERHPSMLCQCVKHLSNKTQVLVGFAAEDLNNDWYMIQETDPRVYIYGLCDIGVLIETKSDFDISFVCLANNACRSHFGHMI